MKIKTVSAMIVMVLATLAMSLVASAQAPRVPPTPIELLVNGGFENGMEGWTRKNNDGGKVVCVGDNNFDAFEGLCSYRHKVTNITPFSSLTQRVTDVTALNAALVSSSEVVLNYSTMGRRADVNKSLLETIKIKIKFTNNTSRKFKTTIERLDAWSMHTTLEGLSLFNGEVVKIITFSILDKRLFKGKTMYTDNASLTWVPVAPLR
jgi:hypothetical protein